MITPAKVILFLTGLLVGLFFAALLVGGALGVNALTLIAIVLVIIYTLKLLSQPDNVYTIVGVAIGAVLALLVAALSPGMISVDTLIILLVLLIVK